MMSDKENNSARAGRRSHRTSGAPGFDATGEAGLEAAVVGMLEQLPAVDVPSDFAAQVAALAVAQPLPSRSAWAWYGPWLTLASGLLLLLAMFVVAAHATPSFQNLRFDLELLLLLELGALVLLVPHLFSRD